MAYGRSGREKARENLGNMKQFKGTLNASWEGEPHGDESTYTVRSYDTPIAQVTRHPETGRMIRRVSNQQFSPTTSNHQSAVRQHLPGEEGPPLEEQNWTRRPWGYVPGREQRPQAARRARAAGHTPDEAHGALVSDLVDMDAIHREIQEGGAKHRIQRVFNDRRG